jgi:hypothetical protein
MASKNVETLRAAHESWNRRDFAGVVRNSAESLVCTFSPDGQQMAFIRDNNPAMGKYRWIRIDVSSQEGRRAS